MAVLRKDDILSIAEPMLTRRGIYLLLLDDEIVYAGQSEEVEHRILAAVKSGKEFDSYAVISCDEETEEEITDLLAEYIVEYTPVYNTILPTNRKWAAIGTIRRLSPHHYNDLKKHIRNNRIKSKNGFYLLSDFVDFLPSEQMKGGR